ncbi:ABC transporter substrate-binding protein [Nocardioides marmoriginsengisoli]|uniref:ABC transporter substrate-binding protein n=1 Tax=Nocardioides marmoriginsengisoli TaxID=661483 RepID=A0A3N0CPJ1_9ACTN|nr:ABC transporter substrate-binding protein [Nocardioides marmoriginsengisoli]RNL65375.1 ABC transporter substrate-binding protein [Nocardioides marmoriginsengisoli]
MIRTLRRVALSAAVLSLLVTAACGGSDSGNGGKSGDPLQAKIGLIGPKSGAAQFYWTELERGIELAEPEIKEKFGVTFEKVEGDDQGSPDVASRVIQTMLNQDNVDVVFGPSQSGPSLQVAETIQRTGRPWLVSIAAADEILNPEASPNWGFRTNNNNSDAIAVSGSYLWSDSDAKVGIFYGADAYGQSNHDMLLAYAKKNGKTVVHEEVIQPGATDVSSQVRKMRDAGVTSILGAVTTGADTAAITKAMDQLGYKPDRFLVTATVLAGYTDLAKPREWENLAFIEPRDLTGDSFAGITQKYEEKYGEKPTSSVAVYTTYTSALLYGQAVAAAKDAHDWKAVRQAMEDTPKLDVNGRVWEKPFGAADHDLYEDDPSSWFVIGFDPEGKVRTIGSAGS